MSLFDYFDLFQQPSPKSNPAEEPWQFNGWPVRIIRQPRRRSISILLKPQSPIIVRTNLNTPRHAIEQFLLQKQDWINKHLLKFSKLKAPTLPKFEPGEDFLFLGQFLKLKTTVTPLRQVFLSYYECHIWLHLPAGLTLPIESQLGFKTLRQFYLREATKLLPSRVNYLAESAGFAPQTIKVKLLRARWGSCSSRGEISLNAFLIAAPTWVIDSVIFHELSHLQHMNHSKQFWSLVRKYTPRHKEADQWLNENLIGVTKIV